MVNKFGLREALGHGFRTLIADALASGTPVLLGVSDTHSAAFECFAEGMAIKLTPTEDAILEWCKTVIEPSLDAPPRVLTSQAPKTPA